MTAHFLVTVTEGKPRERSTFGEKNEDFTSAHIMFERPNMCVCVFIHKLGSGVQKRELDNIGRSENFL